MKYFLDCETMSVYSVPKRYKWLIDKIIDENKNYEFHERFEALEELRKNCKVKLTLDHSTVGLLDS